jgi:cystathionine beta-lyase/cystathionine gamma-synthase
MRSAHGETAEALYLTQSFIYPTAESADARFAGDDPGFIYTRYGNPTVQMFENRLALVEGAEACRATASGMAAVHLALTGLLRAGDHVVAGKALFGSCRWILNNWGPRFGIETTFVDAADTAAWKAAMRPNTKVVFIESPANPLLEITDIAAVAAMAREAGAKVLVDNVFATPIFQKPLQLGADIVIYSATKHIDGQGRVLGGALLGDNAFLDESFRVNRDGYRQLTEAFDASGVEYIPSSGNFVLFRAGTAADAGAKANLALLQRGIIVRPVANYGLPQWLRVSIGLPAENAAFLAALPEALRAAGHTPATA